jgi:hypothetical protein
MPEAICHNQIMTRPPDDPRRYGDPGSSGHDPHWASGATGEVGAENGGSSTRRFDEPPATSAYGDPGYQEPYIDPRHRRTAHADDGYAPGGDAGQYGRTEYDPGPHEQPPYGAAGEQPRGGGSRGRTIVLAALIAVALVVIGVVATLMLTGGSDDDDDGTTPAASSTTSARTSVSRAPDDTETTTSTTTSEAPESTATSRTAPSGVVYQITGRGDVVGLNYLVNGKVAIVAATSAPWSQRVELTNGRARLTAVVIRGPLTCTIMYNGETLATQTSNGGLLTCAASLPSGA